jgi:hypothetical protein
MGNMNDRIDSMTGVSHLKPNDTAGSEGRSVKSYLSTGTKNDEIKKLLEDSK